jgi:glutamine synthetase
VANKKFTDLSALTPGSTLCFYFDRWIDAHVSVHGYSMLRTQLNTDYFQDLFDRAADFDIQIEGHRQLSFCYIAISFTS